MDTRMVYAVNEFCSNFKIGRTKFYEEVSSGNLRTFLVGNKRLISREESAIEGIESCEVRAELKKNLIRKSGIVYC
jgi:hypothetical protein